MKVIINDGKVKNIIVSDERKTIEFAIMQAIIKTIPYHRLTVDKCEELIPTIVNEIFKPQFRWAVKNYLDVIENEDSV